MLRLSRKEIKDLIDEAGDLEINQTAHLHHCKTGEGNDRCYITNKGDVILLYCHHCGGSGIYKPSLSTYKEYKRKEKHDSIIPSGFYLPSDCVSDINLWPISALKWPLSASFSPEMIESSGMQYSKKINRVCVPVIFKGEYKGYIARRIDNKDTGPKYLARRKKESDFIFIRSVNESSRIVIVEDVLSAIKIAEAGYNSIALMGTSLSDEALNHVTSNYNIYDVWLDNDNHQVKIKQAKLKSELSLYGACVLIKTIDDPKTYTLKEIQEILK